MFYQDDRYLVPIPKIFIGDAAAYECEFEIINFDEYLAANPEDADYFEIRDARCSKKWYSYLYEDGKYPEPDHAIYLEPTAS
eukprot:Awhi_evm1s13500